MDNPAITALCRGLARRGIETLAFNWRGVGESSGRASGEIEDAIADYRAALQYVAERCEAPAGILAAGYSFGAAAALSVAAADERVAELILIAPPLGMIPADSLAKIPHCRHTTIVAAEHDQFAPIETIESSAEILGAELLIIRGADHFFSRGGFEQIESAAAAEPRR
jgi:alpha/beta superfamily hydrolase